MTRRLIYSTFPEDNGYEYDSEYGQYLSRDSSDSDLPDGAWCERDDWGYVYCYDAQGIPICSEDYGIEFYDGEWEYDLFCDNFKKTFDSTPTRYVANGTVGRWDGTFAGGTMIDSFDDLTDMFAKYDDITLYDEGGELVLTLFHHDGRDVFTIRELTDKGEAYYDSHPYDDVTRHIAETKGYTKKVNLADKVWGKMKSKKPKAKAKSKSRKGVRR